MKTQHSSFTTSVFALFAFAGLLAAQMDYHDPAELSAALVTLRQQSAHVQLITIGSSPSIEEGRTSGTRHPIYAVRIGSTTSSSIRDNPDRNGILFECGMHPREWLTTESCLKLAQHLANNAENEPSGVPELLRKADVYIVPLTTVAGRWLDDPNHGDPVRFSRDPSTAGWRGNGDRRDCEYGTNVARNFSRGWNAGGACDGNYPGFSPFSSDEAVALRSFVQNRGITMAVVVHSNVEEVNNYWDDVPGNTNVGYARWAWSGGLDMPGLALDDTGVGTGVGQFSAWLAATSNAAGEPDEGTRRGIRTVFLELPFLAANYNGAYRDDPNDESNGFHPSGDGVLRLIDRSFIPMAKVFISYAGYPYCKAGTYCPASDFGLAGAKIGRGYFSPGSIEAQPAYKIVSNGNVTTIPARDYVPTGRYSVYYRVQNLTANAGDADVQVTVDDGVTATRTVQRHALGAYSGTGASVAFDVAGQSTDYTVTIEVRPARGFLEGRQDDFSTNDLKVFKFRSYQVF